ncbi:MAG: hypothetical protein IJ408_06975 [Clostridia bacterium]|nr:hypothetical protein [Clostridia bacterium]
MDPFVPIALGIVCIIIGFFNSKGHIKTLHYCHRKRVSDADRIPFGKIVGLGMIIVGASVIIYGGLLFFKNDVLTLVGSIEMIIGIIIGMILNFYGMIKYNKGIF